MREKRGSLTYYEFQLPFNNDAEELVNKRPGISQYFDEFLMVVSLSCCVFQIIRSCVDLAKDVSVVFDLQCNSNFIANLNYYLQLFIYS